MCEPEISVVMSLYNSAKYLREAVDSVLAQTFANFEFIIIDDGSSDDSVDIVRGYDDVRIHLVCQKNAGLAAALNHAIDTAKTDFIARMDPDDRCFPERLAKQYQYLQGHADVALVGCAAMYITEGGDEIAAIHKQPYIEQEAMTMPETPCIHPSVMFRRDAFKRAGGYPDVMRYGGEDAVLFNRMLSFSAVANLSDVLLHYRLSPHSMSQRSARFNRLLREMVCKQVLNDSVSRDDWDLLIEEYRKKTGGEFGYCLSVGKLLLFGAGQAGDARVYLWRALHTSPLSVQAWGCCLSSYLPQGWRMRLKGLL